MKFISNFQANSKNRMQKSITVKFSHLDEKVYFIFRLTNSDEIISKHFSKINLVFKIIYFINYLNLSLYEHSKNYS